MIFDFSEVEILRLSCRTIIADLYVSLLFYTTERFFSSAKDGKTAMPAIGLMFPGIEPARRTSTVGLLHKGVL